MKKTRTIVAFVVAYLCGLPGLALIVIGLRDISYALLGRESFKNTWSTTLVMLIVGFVLVGISTMLIKKLMNSSGKKHA